MRIGFIGAGKMGFTLGKHIAKGTALGGENMSCREAADILEKVSVAGYYSQNPKSAMEAAEFTSTKCYEDLNMLVDECDALFLTVPDGQIAATAEKLSRLGKAIEGKIICHTSGALSSQVISGVCSQAYSYSIHPMYAVSSKTESYVNFSECYITIEGNNEKIEDMKKVFVALGHRVKVLDPESKVKYHCAAVTASNLVIGLYNMAAELMCECGFDRNEANLALRPLFLNNALKLAESDCEKALTGPVERCDIDTIKKHLDAIEGQSREIYRLLSKELVEVACRKHMENDDDSECLEKYAELDELLVKETRFKNQPAILREVKKEK